MDLKTVIGKLRADEAHLRARGVIGLSVFGSTARKQSADTSDVDLVAKLKTGAYPGLSGLVKLQQELSSLLECRVDLVEEPIRKPSLELEIERDRIIAF